MAIVGNSKSVLFGILIPLCSANINNNAPNIRKKKLTKIKIKAKENIFHLASFIFLQLKFFCIIS